MSSNSSKPTFKDPQYIIAIGVTIISLCALIVSVKQTQIMREEGELMREYSRASVWPRLELSLAKGHNLSDGKINQFSLFLNNSGVGPAIVTDVKITYKEEAITNWVDLFEKAGIADSIEVYFTNRSFNKQVLKIDENLELLNLDSNLPLAQAFYEILNDVNIDIIYESIYKQQWKYEIRASGTETIQLENFEGLQKEEQFLE